ncbi:MAG: DUF3800 domain-containing protein [Acidaminococcus sp.]|jgi:hypothetical protein|nr:DUF3800 domain-containing protein [Acidaminococcus sp.]MCI2099831.1 DUF3800 domain-containing protein [Acidaminococcus sp.]MCI2114060.1 DUF3800 domain-containing protein [Acidaminococcus sp.]MCI2115930.1 DUF3800 domain-containing protein [Acidaminococcus sp.]
MNIYVYSDESGVFDSRHNDIFVFGGLILLGTSEKEKWSRKYSAAEKVIRGREHFVRNYEIKATSISNNDKGKLFRSLNQCFKFGVIINQKKVLPQIFDSKKDKQRYLDFAYKIAVKRAFERLANQWFSVDAVQHLYFYVDEHTTATNGRYELREGLEQEFKFGTYNWSYNKFFPPIFPSMESVNMEYCNSKTKLLIRAADIVANKIYHCALKKDYEKLHTIPNLSYIVLPY